MEKFKFKLENLEKHMKDCAKADYQVKHIGELKYMREDKLQSRYMSYLEEYNFYEKEYDKFYKEWKVLENARKISTGII